MKIKNGELPKQYPNWMAFYRDVKKQNLLSETIFVYSPIDYEFPTDSNLYEFDVDYIKVKCFDEINEQVQDFTCSELDKLQYWLFKYENAAMNEDLFRRLKEKLDNKIRVRYKFGEYD